MQAKIFFCAACCKRRLFLALRHALSLRRACWPPMLARPSHPTQGVPPANAKRQSLTALRATRKALGGFSLRQAILQILEMLVVLLFHERVRRRWRLPTAASSCSRPAIAGRLQRFPVGL